MIRSLSAITFFALTLASVSLHAQSLKDATVTLTSANWKVLRSTDPMKDTTNCTGIYKDDYGIQLGPRALYIQIEGGVDSITLRFGDKPAQSLRLAQSMEKRIRSIIVSDSDFSELESSERLRYQVLTLVRGIKTGDIDLTGLRVALEHIRAGCPVTSPTGEQGVPPATLTGTLCSTLLVNRMKSQGLMDNQVLAICQ